MNKTLVGLIAVALTLLAYIPYIVDILKEKTRPHLYSWLLWAIVTAIVFALQITNHAGAGSYTTLTSALICFLVISISLKKGIKNDITKSDKIFLTLALTSLAVWLITKQAVLSAILATATDLLAFIPTVRKSWNNPHSETIFTYYLNTLRFVLVLYALDQYTVITALYPISWLIINGLFAIMLKVKRKYKVKGSLN